MTFELDLQEKYLDLISPLAPDECARRVAESIDRDLAIASISTELDGTHDVIGHADGGALCLRKRLPSSYSFYGALFKPVFTGVLKPHGAGTLIEGEFAVNGFARGFVKVFCWSVISFLTLMLVVMLLRLVMGVPSPGTLWGLVIPLIVVAGYGYGRLVKRHAQSDIAFVTHFVRETTQV